MNNNLKQILDLYSAEISADTKEKLILWFSATETYYDIDSEANMDDAAFDLLTEELKIELKPFEKAYAFITKSITTITTDGKTEQVIVDEYSEQISLDKIQYESLVSVREIYRWFNGALNNKVCYVGPKMDGHGIKITFVTDGDMRYVKNILTRGGQDITEYLLNHKDVLNLLNNYSKNVVNCEMVLSKKLFQEKWSSDVLADGYANTRNAVGGVLKREATDLKIVALTDGVNPLIGDADIDLIWTKFTPNLDFLTFFQKFKNDTYDYRIDGIVIGYCTDVREVKDNYPLNMVSVKFPASTAKTKVIGFEWSQKKIGNLTPVYLLEPVELDGTICTKANGYNYNGVIELRCGIGSEVIITKSNDIIPIIQKVITKSNNIVFPKVDYVVIGKHARAIDDTISAEYRFVLGLKILQIDGIGETIANQIGKVVNYDIIQLFDPQKKVDIRSILGDGKVFEKFSTIYSIKNIPLDQLIEMMQFNRCGKILARKFAEIITGKKIDTKGIEKDLLLHICKNDGFKLIQASIKILAGFGVRIVKPVEINEDTITFEMSSQQGSNISKKYFIEQFKIKYPNSTHTTLNKNTTFLFVDSLSSTSSKMNRARKYNIPIYTFEDGLKLDNLQPKK